MRLEEGVGWWYEVQYTSPKGADHAWSLEPVTFGEGCCKGSSSPRLRGWRRWWLAGTRRQRSPVPFDGWCVGRRAISDKARERSMKQGTGRAPHPPAAVPSQWSQHSHSDSRHAPALPDCAPGRRGWFARSSDLPTSSPPLSFPSFVRTAQGRLDVAVSDAGVCFAGLG